MKCKRRLMRTAVKGKERMNFYIYYTTESKHGRLYRVYRQGT